MAAPCPDRQKSAARTPLPSVHIPSRPVSPTRRAGLALRGERFTYSRVKSAGRITSTSRAPDVVDEPLRHGHVSVPQDAADGPDVGSRVEQIGRSGVPEGIEVAARDVRRAHDPLEGHQGSGAYRACGKWFCGEAISARSGLLLVRPQRHERTPDRRVEGDRVCLPYPAG